MNTFTTTPLEGKFRDFELKAISRVALQIYLHDADIINSLVYSYTDTIAIKLITLEGKHFTYYSKAYSTR